MPEWAFGLWQSRQRYETAQESLDVVKEFRRRAIPFDNIVQDWQYWKPDSWGSHQFDPARFPDPDGWIKSLHDLHAHVMISVWGKFYPGTANFDAMQKAGFLYQPNLKEGLRDWINYPYTFYDAFNPAARKLYWDQINTALFSKGIDAWWEDATEPDLTASPPTLEGQRSHMNPTAMGTASRVLNGYGSHTYSFINALNERFWVKFHFKTMQGIQTMTNAEGDAIIAKDRESSQRDLFEAIERGEFPKWKFQIQVMPEKDAETYRWNPFDLTKVWPHKDYPMIDVGILELNRNPENYFAEIEQSAFSPSNIVPGIGFSPDKMLQARIFSYADAHRYRIGTHYEMLPVNRPKSAVHTYHADGPMRFDAPKSTNAFYEPNSFGGPTENKRFAEPPLKISGDADRYNHRDGNDDYTQPGDLFRLMSPAQKQQLFSNIAGAMNGVPEEIVRRQLGHFHKADPAYAAGVAKALKLEYDVPKAPESAPTMAGVQ
jgi:hypothetical protein